MLIKYTYSFFILYIYREFYILYGSQTGNAESVAKDFSSKLTSKGIDNKCLTLNAAKKLSIKQLAKCLIVVCSTTGNADAPENADLWWRSVKLRSAVCFRFYYILSTLDNCHN